MIIVAVRGIPPIITPIIPAVAHRSACAAAVSPTVRSPAVASC
jgi:hypothetical protein